MSLQTLCLIHISDIHFGRTSEKVLHDLSTFITAKQDQVHLTILTGDLTQRAKSSEFKNARNFLESIKTPLFLVPGNHDVPLYNLFLRFFSPYRKFLRHIGPFSSNFYEDEKIAIFGLWTTNHFSVKKGRIRERDIADAKKKFSEVGPHKLKIFAAHHPLLSLNAPKPSASLQELISLKPHLFMWGHEHQSRVQTIGPSNLPLFIASGTSTSNRLRAEANSFNLISVKEDSITVTVYRHNGKEFLALDEQRYPLIF